MPYRINHPEKKKRTSLEASEIVRNFSRKERFINRELSWLAFNQRVFEEANNTNHPILERLRFLSISASNLDEFFMVRVAGLVGQVNAGVDAHSQDGMTPREQLTAVVERANQLIVDQQQAWRQIRSDLADHGVNILDANGLSASQRAWLEEYFLDYIMPVLTPLAIDPAHPFPFIPNLGFGLALQLMRRSDGQSMNALLTIPQQLSRFILLPENLGGGAYSFVPIETVVSMLVDRIFPGYDVLSKGAFKIIRDSDIEVAEEAEDLVSLFETALKRRRRGIVIRLKIDHEMPDSLRKLISDEMEVGG